MAVKSEMQQRINVVIGWRSQKLPYRTIISQGMELWGVSKRSVDTYISRADEELTKAVLVDREHLLSLHLSALEQVYKDALSEGDLRIRLDILKHEAALHGLLVQKLDVRNSGHVSYSKQALEEAEAGLADFDALGDDE